MITLNNKKFAKNDEEFIDSLTSINTCVGYYKRFKNCIVLYNMQKNKIGVINKNGVLCKATKLETGHYWYNYGTIDIIGEYDSYMKQVEEVSEVINNLL